jgi:hypothetical protein
MLTPAQFADIVNRVFGPLLSTKGFAIDSDETAQLFVSYLNTGREPSAFARRRIEL